MDKCLEEIDEALTGYNRRIEEISKSSEFEYVCEFKLTEKDVKKIPYDSLNIGGIYLFEIKKKPNTSFKEWIDKFKVKFRGEKKEYLHKFTPNIIEKRIVKYLSEEDKEWIPFYIGKSKRIGERIDKHVNSTLGTPPICIKTYE